MNICFAKQITFDFTVQPTMTISQGLFKHFGCNYSSHLIAIQNRRSRCCSSNHFPLHSVQSPLSHVQRLHIIHIRQTDNRYVRLHTKSKRGSTIFVKFLRSSSFAPGERRPFPKGCTHLQQVSCFHACYQIVFSSGLYLAQVL